MQGADAATVPNGKPPAWRRGLIAVIQYYSNRFTMASDNVLRCRDHELVK